MQPISSFYGSWPCSANKANSGLSLNSPYLTRPLPILLALSGIVFQSLYEGSFLRSFESNCTSTMLCLRILRVVYVISTITVLIPSVVFADRSDIGPMRARRSAQIVDGTAGASSVASWYA